MNDYLKLQTPEEKSYIDLYGRVTNAFMKIVDMPCGSAIITHGGVIRSILRVYFNKLLYRIHSNHSRYTMLCDQDSGYPGSVHS